MFISEILNALWEVATIPTTSTWDHQQQSSVVYKNKVECINNFIQTLHRITSLKHHYLEVFYIPNPRPTPRKNLRSYKSIASRDPNVSATWNRNPKHSMWSTKTATSYASNRLETNSIHGAETVHLKPHLISGIKLCNAFKTVLSPPFKWYFLRYNPMGVTGFMSPCWLPNRSSKVAWR